MPPVDVVEPLPVPPFPVALGAAARAPRRGRAAAVVTYRRDDPMSPRCCMRGRGRLFRSGRGEGSGGGAGRSCSPLLQTDCHRDSALCARLHTREGAHASSDARRATNPTISRSCWSSLVDHAPPSARRGTILGPTVVRSIARSGHPRDPRATSCARSARRGERAARGAKMRARPRARGAPATAHPHARADRSGRGGALGRRPRSARRRAARLRDRRRAEMRARRDRRARARPGGGAGGVARVRAAGDGAEHVVEGGHRSHGGPFVARLADRVAAGRVGVRADEEARAVGVQAEHARLRARLPGRSAIERPPDPLGGVARARVDDAAVARRARSRTWLRSCEGRS